ncbi:unnamed protein product [Rhizoctonia solani]|uniref:P-type H(+)-exporting transporter n=1 Tax=Rhizoctonia solani TaxID=456999 RepID=A0A8H2WIT9_9AGAM|nr:unnamed protein product [Rhizoctonia solani]
MNRGQRSSDESANLIPGVYGCLKIGNVVLADRRLTKAINVSIDQAALSGESLQSKKSDDQCFSGSTCKQGEAEGVVISTGGNTFFGRAASLVGQDDDTTGHLQKILAQIGSFCLVSIGLFVLLEIVILYPRFHYSYRCGLDNILVLLIGGIPIAMPTVLSVTLAVGAQQLAKHKAIVTRITAIEELAGVTILCSDKTGTLTTNKLTIDKELVKCYGPFSPQDVILLAAYASRTENQDAIDQCVVGTLDDPTRARTGIKLLDFKPFNPVDKRTEITYREESSGKLKRVTKGMTGIIIELCTRNKTEEVENQLEADVTKLAGRGLRALAVAYEELDHDNFEGEGNGFELIGLLAIFDPPREDTKQTIDDAIALGVKVKMVTGDQLAIAKETGGCLGLGYVITKAPSVPPAASTNHNSASIAEELRQVFQGPRARYTRGPNPPRIQLEWCPKPPGSPGRANFNVKAQLRMTNAGHNYFRREVRSILQRDVEVDMNKAITKQKNHIDLITRLCHEIAEHFPEFEPFRKDRFWPIEAVIHGTLRNSSGKFNALQQQLKIDEARARGEAIEPKAKKVKAPTAARGRAKVKELKSRAATDRLPTAGHNPTHSVTANENNANKGDTNMHERSFQDVDDPLGDLTHEMSIVAIDSAQDDKPDETHGSILAHLLPDAMSTLFSTRAVTYTSGQSPILPSIVPTPASPSSSTASSRSVATTGAPDVATPVAGIFSSTRDTVTSLPSSSPPQPHTITPEALVQLAQLAALAPAAQRALIPAALWQLLTPSSLPISGSALAPTPTPDLTGSVLASTTKPTPNPPGDDDEPLSDAESASASNPPVPEKKSTGATDSTSRPHKTTGSSSKSKNIPIGGANGTEFTTATLGAKTAKAIKDAKAISQVADDLTDAPNNPVNTRRKGKGKAVATVIDVTEEDQPVNIKRTTKRATRSASKK